MKKQRETSVFSYPKFDFREHVAVVTGAASGIGRAVSLGFAEMGAKLLLVDIDSLAIEEVKEQVVQLGCPKVVTHIADMRKVSEIKTIDPLIRDTFERVDFLFANAGTNQQIPCLEVTEENWNYVVDLNLKGLYFSCQTVGRIMVEQRSGKIVNTASTMGVVGLPDNSVYCATKGGVVQLTKALAMEWARYSINVNAIAPAMIRTPMTEPILKDRRKLDLYSSIIPIGRLGKTRDVVGAVLFLCSSSADFITGTTFMLDGGMTAR
jgi:NAD(P)-dependent dehydrogenase (short-subunit alcohol dehydrogenase family)